MKLPPQSITKNIPVLKVIMLIAFAIIYWSHICYKMLAKILAHKTFILLLALQSPSILKTLVLTLKLL
jgi:hypothetical protein